MRYRWNMSALSSDIAIMEKRSYVYILASGPYGTLYVGSTTDLLKRVWQHREGVFAGFTKQYRVTQLVWYELHIDLMEAGRREKQIKKWNRDWKVNLVQRINPDWRDLYGDISA
jgi:putative endonuclease